MGALVERSCQLAQRGLFARDIEAIAKIAPQDQKIDALGQTIESGCFKLIALYAPMLEELRLLAALMQLVRDLERIGDYAQNIGTIAVQLSGYDPHPVLSQVTPMFDRSRAMLSLSLMSLADFNAQTGLAIRCEDEAVDADYRQLYSLLIQKAHTFETAEPTLLLVLLIRHLERMADHAVNIGRRVAYIVTGS